MENLNPLSAKSKAIKYAHKIKKLKLTIENLKKQLFEELKESPYQSFDDLSFNDIVYWRKYLAYHVLEKIESFFINFTVIESVSLIAIARYLFEIRIQLELLKKDPNYIYYLLNDLFRTQEEYYKRHIDWLEQVEIPKLMELQEEDEKIHLKLLTQRAELRKQKGLKADSNDVLNIPPGLRWKIVDIKGEDEFLIYNDDAQILGYGFTAYLIENKILPKYKKHLDEIRTIKKKFEQFIQNHNLEHEIRKYKKNLKTWRKRAEEVGLENRYDLMYFYSSNLLHGTPLSIITEKRLKEDELFLFLRFSYVEMKSIINLINELNRLDC